MSDMRAGPSAPCSPGSWQFESVIKQRGIWRGKSPCMLLGRNWAKGEEENILKAQTAWELSVYWKWRAGACCPGADGWRSQTKLILGKGKGQVESGSFSLRGACNLWAVQPSPSCSAGLAARAQPVPGFAVGKGIVGARRLPAKRGQTAEGKKCKTDRLQEQNQDSLLPLLLSRTKSSYWALRELCPEDVILLTGACHTAVLFGLTMCAVLIHKAQEIWLPSINFNGIVQTVLPNLKSSLDLWISMHRESTTNPVCIFRSFITFRIKHAELYSFCTSL